MNIRELHPFELETAHRVIGSTAFFGIAMDALLMKRPLSVIRVSDGEKRAMDYCEGRHKAEAMLCCDEGFRQRFGVDGIMCGEMIDVLSRAVAGCTYFAPTMGFYNPAYKIYSYFHHYGKPLVDEMFQYHWSFSQRQALLQQAGRVLVINRDEDVAGELSLQFGDKFHWISLSNWDEAEDVLDRAVKADCRLVLMSAALGSKWIGPEIAERTKSVVLDIGQAADCWHIK